MSHIDSVKELGLRFQAAGIDNARRTAEELIAHVLGCGPLEVYLRDEPPSAEQLKTLEQFARRIESGEPLQYVIGHVDFRGLEIKCDPRALIPRPETELLVEEVLKSAIWTEVGLDRRASRLDTKQFDGRPSGPSLPPVGPAVADIGTGTGCIVLSLAKEHPEAHYIAVDSSPAALELARENAAIHGMDELIEWKQNHLLDGFKAESCDAVIANLPYIASGDWKALPPAVRDHEPRSALDSGPTGLELIEALAPQARNVLIPGGMLFLEIGFDQGDAVRTCLEGNGYRDIRIRQDLAGLDRMAIANP